MLAIRLTPAAEQDLESIHAYTVSEWGSVQAQQYLRGLKASLARLATFPQLGTEIAKSSGVRVWSYQRHRVVYRVSEHELKVSRVFHAAREVDLLLAHDQALGDSR